MRRRALLALAALLLALALQACEACEACDAGGLLVVEHPDACAPDAGPDAGCGGAD